jgi:hypothetical protein
MLRKIKCVETAQNIKRFKMIVNYRLAYDSIKKTENKGRSKGFNSDSSNMSTNKDAVEFQKKKTVSDFFALFN